MFYYTKEGQYYLSKNVIDESGFEPIDVLPDEGYVYYLYKDKKITSEGLHLIEDVAFLDHHHNTLKGLLNICLDEDALINNKRLVGCNLEKSLPKVVASKAPYKVHVLGLGDVGGMMLAAMRLIGGELISEIGIYDLDDNKMKRWLYELNQIKSIDRGPFPPVKGVVLDQLFDCDVFIFTASSQIPEVGSDVKDVRMYQLEKNAKIIEIYAKMAAKCHFKGQFLVVSDPVDLLCKAVLIKGDGRIKPEQIKGFGLGVMHARACYYAEQMGIFEYENKGRAFGPHGQHLIIANDMSNYDQGKSCLLTEKTIHANLDIRAVGYKPFIAPALSSAALSILAYLEGKPHYSTVYADGVYFGCQNQALALNLFSIEKHEITPELMERLETTYRELSLFEF